jgi:hypothetical protein
MNEDQTIRAALDRHWAASDANDFEVGPEIYRDDAMLEHPLSGELIRGRRNIEASRFAQPNKKRFTMDAQSVLPTFESLSSSLHTMACHLTR